MIVQNYSEAALMQPGERTSSPNSQVGKLPVWGNRVAAHELDPGLDAPGSPRIRKPAPRVVASLRDSNVGEGAVIVRKLLFLLSTTVLVSQNDPAQEVTLG